MLVLVLELSGENVHYEQESGIGAGSIPSRCIIYAFLACLSENSCLFSLSIKVSDNS